MLGSTILDVAIGIVFIFLLVSLIASAIREGLETWLRTRASHLEAGLREVLQDPDGTGLVKSLYNHPLVYSLFCGEYVANPGLKTGWVSMTRGRNLPSYIPSRNFAVALMDMAARGPQTITSTTAPVTLDSIRSNIGSIQNPAVQRALLIALDGAAGDLTKAQTNLEAWYNSAMDRISGRYKRATQTILLALGLIMAVSLNISTIRIGETLYHDKTAREWVVASAEKFQAKPQTYDDASRSLGQLSDLIGWPKTGATEELKKYWAPDIAGWLITAFAVSIGAPFWFDLLNKLIVIRSTVKPHQKSQEESSADKQSFAPSQQSFAPSQNSLPAPAMPQSPPPPPAGPPPPVLDQDGCDVDSTIYITTDDLLPAAMGGIQA